jgi:enamine deaminase RidA (YjgF/YER057c/UK114 family)
MSHESRLAELKLELPSPSKSLGLYRPVHVIGKMAYLSGHGPLQADGKMTCGRLGDGMDVAAGYEAARRTALATLGSLRDRFGSLDAIARLAKTTAFVNATPDFKDHPAVVNGFSELLRDVFGPEAGVGARSAVGVASLPAGWAVEIDTVFELA